MLETLQRSEPTARAKRLGARLARPTPKLQQSQGGKKVSCFLRGLKISCRRARSKCLGRAPPLFWCFGLFAAALRCSASWEASQAVGNSQRASMSSVNVNVNANASVKVRDNVDEARPLLVNARLCCSTWVAAGREKEKTGSRVIEACPLSSACVSLLPVSLTPEGNRFLLFFFCCPFFCFLCLVIFPF